MSASTWQALLVHVDDLGDLGRVADSASLRLLYCYAEPLYRRLADHGDQDAAFRLAELLVEQGRVEEALAVLRPRADAGDRWAARRLAGLLVEQGRVEEAQCSLGEPQPVPSQVRHIIAEGLVPIDPSGRIPGERALSGPLNPASTRKR